MSIAWNNLKISQKVISSLGLIIIFSLLLGALSIYQMNSMHSEIDHLVDVANISVEVEDLLFDVDYMIHMMHHYLENHDLEKNAVTRLTFENKSIMVSNSLVYILKELPQFDDDIKLAQADKNEITNLILEKDIGIFDHLQSSNEISEAIHDDYPAKISEILTLSNKENVSSLIYNALEAKYHFERMIHMVHHYLEYTNTGVGGSTLITFNSERSQYNEHIAYVLANSTLNASYAQFNSYVQDDFIPSVIGTNGMFSHIDAALVRIADVHEIFPNLITHLEKVSNAAIALATTDVESNVSSAITLIIIMLISAIAVGIAVTIIINKTVAKPVKNVAAAMDKGKTGDIRLDPIETDYLSMVSKRNDEIGSLGSSFSMFINNLRGLIAESASNVKILATSSENIVSGAEEINASSEEVASTSQAMSDGATTQTELISEVNVKITDAQRLVDEIVAKIQLNTQEVAQIALQTNILALNAGIEASRAGDYGRGFAVVAENVRKLSDQSKLASERIEAVAADIRETLQSSFHDISQTMVNVVSVSEETAASAQEVAAAAEEMTATIEELSSAANELSQQAEKSQQSIDIFQY